MQYLFVGAGQAGTQIVDQIFAHDNIDLRAEPLAFNSTIQDLERLNNVPQERWYGVSESEGLVNGTVRGFEEQVTGGFGQTPTKADRVMRRNEGEVHRVLDEVYADLFEHARLGLDELGVSESQIDDLLAPLEARWQARTAPSDWRKARVAEHLDAGEDLSSAVLAAQRDYLDRASETETFAEWL